MTSTSFAPFLFLCSVIFSLRSNESVVKLLGLNLAISPLLKASHYLQYCNKLPDVFK